MSEPTNGRISVSEDKLRLLFAEFKLDLVKELAAYATVTSLEMFKKEVTDALNSLSVRMRVLEDDQTGEAAVSRYKKILAGAVLTLAAGGIGELIYLLATAGGHS